MTLRLFALRLVALLCDVVALRASDAATRLTRASRRLGARYQPAHDPQLLVVGSDVYLCDSRGFVTPLARVEWGGALGALTVVRGGRG